MTISTFQSYQMKVETGQASIFRQPRAKSGASPAIIERNSNAPAASEQNFINF